jgi:hypothetical protein
MTIDLATALNNMRRADATQEELKAIAQALRDALVLMDFFEDDDFSKRFYTRKLQVCEALIEK